jgi:hypothetical protein
MKLKAFKISLLSLVLALFMSLSALVGLNISVFASTDVTVNGTNSSGLFTASGDAKVIANRYTTTDGGTEVNTDYTMFVMGNDSDSVSFKKNLAYHWFTSNGEGFYSMNIGFVSTSFERFVIKYESQEFNKTKDGKATNYVIFYPSTEEGKVFVAVTDEEDLKLDADNFAQVSSDNIWIKFTEKLSGSYTVYVGNDSTATTGTFAFENVGGNYVKNSNTTSNSVTPMSFYAEFESEDSASAKMVLFSLNGQAFELKDTTYSESDDYYYGGTVTDDTAPVLCLDNDVRYFDLNDEIDFDYAVIDVLQSNSSTKSTVNYYVLTYDQYINSDGSITDYNDETLFSSLSSSDNILLVSGRDKFYPGDLLTGTKFDTTGTLLNEDGEEAVVVDMLMKVYVNIKDQTSGASDNVYLDWYLPTGYTISTNNSVENSSFIAVATDNLGLRYNNSDEEEWAKILADYQALVDENAKDLSAGSSSYFYLPSVESLFADNMTSYTDLTISIYYYHNTQSSNTGLSTSNLYINLTQQGPYTFTVYATDSSSNNMYYIDTDADGNQSIVTFAASEIWTMFEDEDDEGLRDLLPWFTFEVGYTGVEFDEVPGLQSTAYVGTSYTSASFSINGISGSYETSYRLFKFDRAGYALINDGVSLTYAEFVAQLDDLFDNHRDLFEEILALADMEETDDEYDLYADYEWSSSSTTFTPQDANTFYLIRAEVTDTQYNIPKTCNLGVVASVQASTLKGESEWLKNNVASIVLLSIAGAALIGIIVLLCIKPKDKEDIDVQFKNAENKEKKTNKSAKAKKSK